jgi:hypothetical protein
MRVCCIAGGDGPKRGLLEQMIAQESLASRVKLAGAIPHERAREFLVRICSMRTCSMEPDQIAMNVPHCTALSAVMAIAFLMYGLLAGQAQLNVTLCLTRVACLLHCLLCCTCPNSTAACLCYVCVCSCRARSL